LILSHPELRELFDIKIFVHADSDERLIRRLKRDIAERGRDMEEVLNRYQTTLKPMHQQFIESTKAFVIILLRSLLSAQGGLLCSLYPFKTRNKKPCRCALHNGRVFLSQLT
jgi:uridine kinase